MSLVPQVLTPTRDRIAAEIRALFEAARRRRRHRRLVIGCVLLASAIAVAGAGIGLTLGPPRQHQRAAMPRRNPVSTTARRLGLGGPPAVVAWFDNGGVLHLGDVATLAQRIMPRVAQGKDGGSGLVQAGDRLFWASFPGGVIKDADLATGKTRDVTRGDAVALSADGRNLLISRHGGSVVAELPVHGTTTPRLLTLPAGWSVAGFGQQDREIAGGLVVSSTTAGPRAAATLGIWDFRTGAVISLGRGYALAAYTPPDGRSSLLAWQPVGSAACRPEPLRCPVAITNTATLATVTVRSQLGHGFGGSDAFSPDGRHLAVFANLDNPQNPQGSSAELGVIDTGTGSLRLYPAARLDTTCVNNAWAVWLPGGRRLLTGGLIQSYAVSAATGSAEPFYFYPGGADQSIQGTLDINYSTILVSAANSASLIRGAQR